MNESKKILISGASIAGPTLAYWLNRYGDEVTVIERSKTLRTGGQNVDIEGSGQGSKNASTLRSPVSADAAAFAGSNLTLCRASAPR